MGNETRSAIEYETNPFYAPIKTHLGSGKIWDLPIPDPTEPSSEPGGVGLALLVNLILISPDQKGMMLKIAQYAYRSVLFTLVGWSLGAGAGPTVPISEYREQKLRPQLLFPDAPRALIQSQIALLDQLNARLMPPGCQTTPVADPAVLEGVLSVVGRTRAQNLDIDVEDALSISRHIESSLERWRSTPEVPIPGYHFISSPSGRLLEVRFHLDVNNNLYLDVGNQIGQGRYKDVRRLFGYRTFRDAALTVNRQPENESYVRAFQREIRVLERIGALPAASRRGLVEPIFVNSGPPLQHVYESSLAEAAKDPRGPLYTQGSGGPNEALYLELFAQLGEGTATLHSRLHLVHSDIKPANILIHTNPLTGRPEAVLADFGLSFSPEADLRCNQPYRGYSSAGYMGPEIVQGYSGYGWERAENLYKGDVFALSATLAALLRPQMVRKLLRCRFETRTAECAATYAPCAETALRTMREHFGRTTDPITRFLLRGLESNVFRRPTLEIWRNELNQVRTALYPALPPLFSASPASSTETSRATGSSPDPAEPVPAPLISSSAARRGTRYRVLDPVVAVRDTEPVDPQTLRNTLVNFFGSRERGTTLLERFLHQKSGELIAQRAQSNSNSEAHPLSPDEQIQGLDQIRQSCQRCLEQLFPVGDGLPLIQVELQGMVCRICASALMPRQF